jgi:hypothetical protein
MMMGKPNVRARIAILVFNFMTISIWLWLIIRLVKNHQQVDYKHLSKLKQTQHPAT